MESENPWPAPRWWENLQGWDPKMTDAMWKVRLDQHRAQRKKAHQQAHQPSPTSPAGP